jgi:hypothetical protein
LKLLVSFRNRLSFLRVSGRKSDTLPLLRACAALLALSPAVLPAATVSVTIRTAEDQFRAANPCPTSGRAHGPCTGYVIDRIIPIACGGAEQPDNMRWITLPEAKEKARWERIGCRPGRKLVLPGEHTSVTESFALDGAGSIEAAPIGTGSTAAAKPSRAAPATTDSPPQAEPSASPEEEDLPHE